METITILQARLHEFSSHILLVVGLITMLAFYFGKIAKLVKLPSIIGFIVLGVLLGPSLFDLIGESVQARLSFITEIALGFVALSIGLELNIRSLSQHGVGIISIILAESFGTFLVVLTGIYLLTRNLPLSLIFAAIAPASAPAGTVAIIQEYRARGPLTKVLYAVVGFDDGLGVMIFGFAAAIAHKLLLGQTGGGGGSIWYSLGGPLEEIVLSLVAGAGLGFIFSLLARRLNDSYDVSILVFSLVLVLTGLCKLFHLSLILTNMMAGLLIINTQPLNLVRNIRRRLPDVLPLLFILFFTLAGAGLHIQALPALGIIGLVYFLTRSAGLVAGSWVGGIIGKVEDKIRRYVGMGILSQAGLAIGLSLIVKQEFSGLGRIIPGTGNNTVTTGDQIGTIVLTTVTATCILFEIIGPILTKVALTKAGEIGTKEY